MILSYIIATILVLFTSLVHGRPTGTSALKPHHLSSSVEPDTLLGRHYSLQDRHEASRSDHAIQATTKDDRSFQASRRAIPFPKYIADRSDVVWVRRRTRRAEPMTTELIADSSPESNYVSHVGPYSYSVDPVPPPPPPPPRPAIDAALPPTSNSTSLTKVAEASSTSTAAAHESEKATHKKDKGKHGHKGGKKEEKTKG